MGLETAQAIGLIGSAVSWNGQAVTLVNVNGADALIDTGSSSEVVALSDLGPPQSSALVSRNEHFTTPGIFRAMLVSEPATCSVTAEEDPDLQMCFDPRNLENLDEILRQASSPGDMGKEGRAALREAARQARAQGPEREREFNQKVQDALAEIGEENPCDLPGAQQAYTEVQASLPPAGSNAGNNGGNGAGNNAGNGGNGAPVALAPGGGVPVSGNAIVGQPVMANASFVDVVTGIITGSPAAAAGDAPPANNNDHVSNDVPASGVLPALIAAASLPIPFNPVSAFVPAFLSSASVGVLEAPRSKDPAREANFFQALFGPELADNPTSGIVELLVRPTASFASKLYDVRRAVAEVIRTYNALYGAARPGDRDASIPLNFRSDPERRRIEVSIDPTGGSEAPRVAEGDRQETGFDSLRGPFRSLPLLRLGSDDHRRDPDAFFAPIVAYIPMPSQYLQGVRLGDGVITARGDGRATDRGVERLARRDSANDQHGGSHSDEREGRGSRGGRGNRDRRQQDQEALYEDELDSSVAA